MNATNSTGKNKTKTVQTHKHQSHHKEPSATTPSEALVAETEAAVNRKETKSQNPDSPLSTRKPSESTTHHDPSQQRRNQKKHRRRKGHTRKQRRMAARRRRVLTKPKGVRQWCSHKRLRR
jgi:hypothetical protein